MAVRTLRKLHFIFSPLLWLLPLRRLVALIVIILLAVAFADHLLPVAGAPLLLWRPPQCIPVAVARFVIKSFRFFVLLVRAGAVAGLDFLAVALAVIYVAFTASFI